MSSKKPQLGQLNTLQFVQHCSDKGLAMPPNHMQWIIEQGFILPVRMIGKKPFFNMYQLYTMDRIEDYREKSLTVPRSSTDSPLNWQEYLNDNKEAIINISKEWNPVAQLILDIQPIYNDFLNKSLKAKNNLEDITGTILDTYFKVQISNEGPKVFDKILNEHKKLDKKDIETWMSSKLPFFVFKHNPTFKLFMKDPTILKLFRNQEMFLTKSLSQYKPVRLANHYFDMINYLNFSLRCLNKGKGHGIFDIFKIREMTRICAICKDEFKPRKSGKTQTICSKKECDKESRRIKAVNRRRNKKSTVKRA